MKTILYLSAFVLSLAVATPGLRANDAPAAPAEIDTAGTPTVLKFSDPAKPGTVKIRTVWGDTLITAADTAEVTIVANVKNKRSSEHRADGLRRLDSEITFTATEKDNVITVTIDGDAQFASSGARLNVTVPRHTSVIIQNTIGGNATVVGVIGDVEIHSINGEVALDQIDGSALVETMNGRIHATFTKVAEAKPLSFTSMNGEIDVRIPAATRANVRLRTQNGAVYTDFDEKALVTKTEPVRGHRARGHRIVVHTSNSSDSDDDGDWHTQVRDAVREATRAGVEAAHEALEAARDAAEAAREGVADARDRDEAPGAPESPVPPVPPVPGVSPMPPVPPVPPVVPTISGGKIVSGTLNGGGAEIQIATMNGTITLRKTQP